MGKITRRITKEVHDIGIDVIDFLEAVEVGDKYNTLANGESATYVDVNLGRVSRDNYGELYEEGTSYWTELNV